MATAIRVPKMGQTVETCRLLEWLVKKGEYVTQGDPLFSIETDKAAFDIEASASGILKEVFFEARENVPVGMIIGVIGDKDEDTSEFAPVVVSDADVPLSDGEIEEQEAGDILGFEFDMSMPEEEEEDIAALQNHEEQQEAPPEIPENTELTEENEGFRNFYSRVFISPRAKRLAREKGIDYSTLHGSGPGGRIKERDILELLERHAEEGADLSSGPDARAPMQTGMSALQNGLDARDLKEELHIPLSGPRKTIAQKMVDSLAQAAQFTLQTTVDASDVVRIHDRLKNSGEPFGLPPVTYNDLIHFAVSRVLLEHRELNAWFSWEEIVQPAAVHLAFAVDTPQGVYAPVLRDAHRKSFAALAREAANLAAQVREGQIEPDMMSGATFTVTNVGQLDVEYFTPILHPPQVAILGVGAIHKQAFETASDCEFRPVIQFSLTIDHRAVDGAPGGRFLQALKNGVENMTLLFLREVID